VVVKADGTVGSSLAIGADAIRALVAQTAAGGTLLLPMLDASQSHANGHHNGHQAGPAPARIGEPAPSITLPDLDGNTVDLTSFQGTETLVLFWNPACGFCQQMVDDLKTWENRRPKKAPRLLVVSTGTVDANRALGLRSTVVLERRFNTGYSFGINGTPSAVLVDAQGKIASPPAVGAEAVLALASGRQVAQA
jgi:hypothetical protein